MAKKKAKTTRKPKNEQTSKKVASKAAKLMKHPSKKVRSVAASALTQAPNKPKAATKTRSKKKK